MDETARPEVESVEQRVSLLLSDSKALLPEGADTEWYEEVMKTTQFELALDELTRLGNEHRAPSGFWRNLTSIAALLGLPERIAELRARSEA